MGILTKPSIYPVEVWGTWWHGGCPSVRDHLTLASFLPVPGEESRMKDSSGTEENRRTCIFLPDSSFARQRELALHGTVHETRQTGELIISYLILKNPVTVISHSALQYGGIKCTESGTCGRCVSTASKTSEGLRNPCYMNIRHRCPGVASLSNILLSCSAVPDCRGDLCMCELV